jgi:hypothetical protein
MVNKLKTFDECEYVYKEISKGDLDADAANKFIKEHLEQKGRS